jgi:hypothetical protein
MGIRKPIAKGAMVRDVTDLSGAVPLGCQINRTTEVMGYGEAFGFCHSSCRCHRTLSRGSSIQPSTSSV